MSAPKPIWFKDYTLDMLEGIRNANMGTHIGFEFTEIGLTLLKAACPSITVQPSPLASSMAALAACSPRRSAPSLHG